MTGDDSVPLAGGFSHEAGIIPRVLYQLFNAIEVEGIDFAIKCSFIELYNEELRDLLGYEDNKKLTILDPSSHNIPHRNSSAITKGQENVFLQSASDGIEILQKGLKRRQVASTNMNDLSSRSHTIFTITVYMSIQKRNRSNDKVAVSESYLNTIVNESYVVGKINLVDLAGSESIGKSGAENKRAREAGIINQSLLTLGRVINALVDKSPHIPYRESKLTRLLHDSLGGHTRTCIIATVSPASMNYDETISTLEYASKAKNIRNKPQTGSLVSKTTLLKEWSDDYIRLRRDWEATRKKHGVYLTEDHYKEIIAENDERKLRMEEQQRNITSFEAQLKSARDMLEIGRKQLVETKKHLTTVAQNLTLTQSSLATKEEELNSTKSTLLKGSKIHKISEDVEIGLSQIANELISNLEKQLNDIHTLQDKLDQSKTNDKTNMESLELYSKDVKGSYSRLEHKIERFSKVNDKEIQHFKQSFNEFLIIHNKKLSNLSESLQSSTSEIMQLIDGVELLEEDAKPQFEKLKSQFFQIQESTKGQIITGLGNLKKVTEDLVHKTFKQVGEYKKDTHTQAESLKSEFTTVFNQMKSFIDKQSKEVTELNDQFATKTKLSHGKSQDIIDNDLANFIAKEKEVAEKERTKLIQTISELIVSQKQKDTQRITSLISNVQSKLGRNNDDFLSASEEFIKSSKVFIDNQHDMKKTLDDHHKEVEAHISKGIALTETHGQNLESTANTIQHEIHEVLGHQTEVICNKLSNFDTHFDQLDTLRSHLRSAMRDRFTKLHYYSDILAVDTVKKLEMEKETEKAHEIIDEMENRVSEGVKKVVFDSKSIIRHSRKKVEGLKYISTEVSGNTPPRRQSFDIPARDISVKKILEGYGLISSVKSNKHSNFDFSLNLGDNNVSNIPVVTPSKQHGSNHDLVLNSINDDDSEDRFQDTVDIDIPSQDENTHPIATPSTDERLNSPEKTESLAEYFNQTSSTPQLSVLLQSPQSENFAAPQPLSDAVYDLSLQSTNNPIKRSTSTKSIQKGSHGPSNLPVISSSIQPGSSIPTSTSLRFSESLKPKFSRKRAANSSFEDSRKFKNAHIMKDSKQ